METVFPFRCFRLVRVTVAAFMGICLAGCESGPSETASRQWDETVDVGTEPILQLDSLISLSIVGERRDDVVLEYDATVVASSTTAAQQAVDSYEAIVERPGDGIAYITFGPPAEGTISGRVTARIPRDFDVLMLQRSGSASVTGIDGQLNVESVGDVNLINPAGATARIRSEYGNVWVVSGVPGGSALDVEAGTGSIQLDLPLSFSANVYFEAAAGLTSTHPDVPSRPGGVPYDATVGSGLASIVATTRGGTIICTVRNGS